jgi:HTH-type transcriptional regulator/antitoxin HigA
MTVIAKSKLPKPQPIRTPRFNRARYGELLRETLPAVIQSEAEYDRLVAAMNKLAVKPRLSPEEDRLLDLLSALVEAYDQKHYAIPQATPAMVIRMLIQDRGLKNKDLESVLGSSGVTSEVINGKRNPSKAQIKALAQFFQVSPELFVATVV